MEANTDRWTNLPPMRYLIAALAGIAAGVALAGLGRPWVRPVLLLTVGVIVVAAACAVAGSLPEARRLRVVARDWVPFWASTGLGAGLILGSLRRPSSPETDARPARRRRARQAHRDERDRR